MTTKTPVAKTGYTSSTSKKYVIDAAVVYKNLEFDSEQGWIGELIGATNGGVNLTIENTYRQPEVDGARHVKLKDNDILETASANVVAKMKEISVAVLTMAINGTSRESETSEAPAGYHVIESKRYVVPGDYIGNIAFVGRISGTDNPIIGIIDNAFVTSSLPIETEDNNEVVIEITFEARASQEQLSADTFPWRIFYPEVA